MLLTLENCYTIEKMADMCRDYMKQSLENVKKIVDNDFVYAVNFDVLFYQINEIEEIANKYARKHYSDVYHKKAPLCKEEKKVNQLYDLNETMYHAVKQMEDILNNDQV